MTSLLMAGGSIWSPGPVLLLLGLFSPGSRHGFPSRLVLNRRVAVQNANVGLLLRGYTVGGELLIHGVDDW